MARSFELNAVRLAEGKKTDPDEPEDHALGRSRGGYTTKIHLICDRQGEVLHFHLTPGQTHDSIVFDTLMIGIDEALAHWKGTVIPWPQALPGDKGYRADWIDEYLIHLGINPVIPSKENEDRNARNIVFDQESYRQRNIVERVIGWLKEFRRIFSRFEKTAKNFGGMIKMGIIQRSMRNAIKTEF